MRFWTPKIHIEETNWSVILNPLKGELDKKRVAEKISELFRISFEEARELVQNTPIILMDELSHPMALQLQSLLAEVRAEVTITNEPLMKRRCYRAVWPEAPKLPFMKPVVGETITITPAEEALVETKAQSPSVPAGVTGQSESFREPFLDLEKRYRELAGLYEAEIREKQEMRQNFERMLKEEAEKNAAELRSTIEEWGEQTESLKEEYQETRAIYEEKVLAYEKEIERLKAPLQELVTLREKAASLEKQNQGFSEKLAQLESSRETLEKTLKERSDEMGLWREKYHSLAQKAERFESLYEEEKKRHEQAEEVLRQTTGTLERTRQEAEIHAAEAKRWRTEFEQLEESQKRLEQQFSQFSQDQDAELKQLKKTNQELATQLELTQRQARGLLLRVEEQQLIEKRSRIAGELMEKESILRQITAESDRLREEINERQQRLQSLTSEQSDLEKKILDMKQTHRYVLEQSKMKDKSAKFKRVGTDPNPDDLVAPV